MVGSTREPVESITAVEVAVFTVVIDVVVVALLVVVSGQTSHALGHAERITINSASVNLSPSL